MTPLDVVKVRLQGETEGVSSFRGTFAKILRNEGWISLYRGFLPTMLMSLPGTVVYFVSYERVRDSISNALGAEAHTCSPFVPLISGSLARIFAASAVSPIELIRTRMQFKGAEHGKLLKVTKDLGRSVQSEGLKVLWRGLQPTLWRDVPFSAIYWSILEPSKSYLNRKYSSSTKASNSIISFSCGAFAGAIAAAITTPFDVAKTRQQLVLKSSDIKKTGSCPSTTWFHLKQIWREAGWAGLTRGMFPRIAKVAPACAIMIASYEFGKSYLETNK